MALSEDMKAASMGIDQAVRRDAGDEFDQLALADYGFGYSIWYARLITGLTVLAGEARPLHGQARIDGSNVDLSLVTEELVIVGQVFGAPDSAATMSLKAVSRSAIQSLEVDASMAVNEHPRLMHTWPGNLDVTASYAGLNFPVRFTGPSYDRDAEDRVSSLWTLVEHLRSDLARQAQ